MNYSKPIFPGLTITLTKLNTPRSTNCIINLKRRRQKDNLKQQENKAKIAVDATPFSSAFGGMGLNAQMDDNPAAEFESLVGSYLRDADGNDNDANIDILEAIDVARTEIDGGSLQAYQARRHEMKVNLAAEQLGLVMVESEEVKKSIKGQGKEVGYGPEGASAEGWKLGK